MWCIILYLYLDKINTSGVCKEVLRIKVASSEQYKPLHFYGGSYSYCFGATETWQKLVRCMFLDIQDLQSQH